MAKAGTVGRLAARICGVPLIVHTYHGHVFHSYFGPLKTRVFLTIERALGLATAPHRRRRRRPARRDRRLRRRAAEQAGADPARPRAGPVPERRTRARRSCAPSSAVAAQTRPGRHRRPPGADQSPRGFSLQAAAIDRQARCPTTQSSWSSATASAAPSWKHWSTAWVCARRVRFLGWRRDMVARLRRPGRGRADVAQRGLARRRSSRRWPRRGRSSPPPSAACPRSWSTARPA